jgi:UDP-N-acetylglucosamine--N-acetylmuramyl-(pentapeptide) pyrophosphoryl-undecaprenol N-acetylglucosamine transferase
MKIVLTGGGTGGHITPILALAHELKRLNPDTYIVYIGEHGGKFAEMTADNPDIDEIHSVWAGKFRRYHGESWLRRLIDLQTNLLNIRDLLYFFFGTLQSIMLLKRLKPDTVFLKGGFVGAPTGLAAAFWKIPFVTHDSDSMPGLANRLVARWAKYHATAMPAENYGYPKNRVKHVGVLVSDKYHRVTKTKQAEFKRGIGVPEDCELLLVTGGSSGAENINKAIRALVPQLFEDYQDLYVIHQVGKGKAGAYEGYAHPRLHVAELLFPLHPYTGASDLVVTRAGANAMAELGVQGKACIVVPNPLLTGGHQTKNAESYEKQGVAKVVKESTLKQNPEILDAAIRELLKDDKQRQQLGDKLHANTIQDATQKLAVVILEVATKKL